MTRGRSASVLVVAALLAGCTSAAPAPAETATEPASPLATCEDLATPEENAPAAGLPALTLPCFTGGAQFTLSDLRGPAVVNLWASWCPPCRDELPILQRFADQAAGEVRVVGVITEDRAPAAASLAQDLGLTFPSLDDPDRALMRAAGLTALPTTLYIDGAGELAYYHQGPLDEETLAQQVREHLGLVV